MVKHVPNYRTKMTFIYIHILCPFFYIIKGDLISESFSYKLKSPKMCAKSLTLASTLYLGGYWIVLGGSDLANNFGDLKVKKN